VSPNSVVNSQNTIETTEMSVLLRGAQTDVHLLTNNINRSRSHGIHDYRIVTACRRQRLDNRHTDRTDHH